MALLFCGCILKFYITGFCLFFFFHYFPPGVVHSAIGNGLHRVTHIFALFFLAFLFSFYERN